MGAHKTLYRHEGFMPRRSLGRTQIKEDGNSMTGRRVSDLEAKGAKKPNRLGRQGYAFPGGTRSQPGASVGGSLTTDCRFQRDRNEIT